MFKSNELKFNTIKTIITYNFYRVCTLFAYLKKKIVDSLSDPLPIYYYNLLFKLYLYLIMHVISIKNQILCCIQRKNAYK